MKGESRKSVRPMAHFAKASCYAALIGLFIGSSVCPAGSQKSSPDNRRLIGLAAARFPNLTRAERAMLWFSDVENVDRGEIAVSGPSSNRDDSSNDPAHAREWDTQREIRASLIRWLCTDPDAIRLVDPGGIKVLGARIADGIDLSNIRVPFAITLRRCAIAQRLRLAGAEIPQLDLNGSYTGEVEAEGLNVDHKLSLGDGFRASGEVDLENAKIGGDLYCRGGHFNHSARDMAFWAKGEDTAIDAWGAVVGGDALLVEGFESDGSVNLDNATVSFLFCWGGKFFNPHKTALSASFANLGNVDLGDEEGTFEANGSVEFLITHVKAAFSVQNARFMGGAADKHGLDASGMTAPVLIWHNATLENGAVLDLGGAQIAFLLDEEKSWPVAGKLMIDGFKYDGFGSASDPTSRLRWIGLNANSTDPQPYSQLAQVLRASGDDAGANRVLIAREDARFARYGLVGTLWGGLLKATIGYGHRPLLAVFWSLAVILIGWGVVRIARSARVMRPTWPENSPRSSDDPYEELNPLLYSIDLFFPFVNFHQEHYWWPDTNTSGECVILGRRIKFSGRIVRQYLWLQIAAGWLLSAIFLAGVTGLIRSD